MGQTQFLIYFLANALPKLAMLVVLFVLARLLPLAEMGLFVLVIAVGEVLEMPAGSWLRIYLLNSESGRAALRPYRAGRLLVLGAAATLGAVLLALPVGAIVAPGRFGDFVLAVSAYIVGFAVLRTVLTVLQFAGDHARYACVEIARGLVIVPAVLAGPLTGSGHFLAAALALSLATVLAALAGLVLALPRLTRPRFSRAGLWPALLFGLPVLADTILSLLISYFDRFALNQLLGPASVALYALAYALGRQPIDFLVGPLNTLALPKLFSAYTSEGREGAQSVQTGLAISMFIMCAGMFTGMLLLRQPVVELLLKPEYRAETAQLMPMVTLAACCLVFKSFLFDNVFHMLARNSDKIASVLVWMLASIAITTGLVWWQGLAGAATAMLLSSIFGLAISIVTSRRFFAFPVPLRRFAFIAAAAIVAGVALAGAAKLAAPYGAFAEIAAGFAAFCAIYALGLRLQGVSLAALVSTPWEPLRREG